MTVADYIEANDIKNALLSDQAWDTSYDTELGRIASAASRVIDRLTMREPGAFAVSTDSTRYFSGTRGIDWNRQYQMYMSGDITRELWIGELADVPTSVSMTIDTPRSSNYTLMSYTSNEKGDYFVEPANFQSLGVPINRLVLDIYNGAHAFWYPWDMAVKVVGKFGYSVAPPNDIVQATLIVAVRSFMRAKQGFQDVSAIVELGQLRYVSQVDPEVQAILEDGHYVQPVVI